MSSSRLGLAIGRGVTSFVKGGTVLESSKNFAAKSLTRSFGIAKGTPPRLNNGVSELIHDVILCGTFFVVDLFTNWFLVLFPTFVLRIHILTGA